MNRIALLGATSATVIALATFGYGYAETGHASHQSESEMVEIGPTSAPSSSAGADDHGQRHGGHGADDGPGDDRTASPSDDASASPSDDASSSSGSDDGSGHDVGDDHGGDSSGSDDGSGHDAGDDHGGHGSDDGSGHDAGDDHGGHGGDDNGGDDHGGHGSDG